MAYRRESWRELVRMEADIALLQEPCRVPDEVAGRVDTGPPDDDAWDTRLWQKPTRGCASSGWDGPSFVPSQHFRDLRSLSRHRRKLVTRRAQVRNQTQKVIDRAASASARC